MHRWRRWALTLFAPYAVHYLPVVGMVRSLPLDAVLGEGLATRNWDKSGESGFLEQGGFHILVYKDQEVLGRVLVEGLAFPERRDDYLRLAAFVTPVLALFILNGRIHERLRTMEAVRREKNVLRAVLDAVPAWISYLDREGCVVVDNRQQQALFGLSAPEDSQGILWETMTPLLVEEHRGFFARCLAGETVVFTKELSNIQSKPFISGTYVPVCQENGQLLGVIVVIGDITQRKQMEAELIRSNAELEQFAYAVSHDMRQPLRMVGSYLTLLENALVSSLNEENRQFLDFAIDGAKRMDAMILSLLDYARIGRNPEPITQISSKRALEEALFFLNPELNVSGGTVEVTGAWPQLFANQDELTRLLQNLIGNALKYHQENQSPHVHVHGAMTATSFRVEIRDQGIGIEPSQMDRLFKVFSRLQARTRFEGTGVGLALCRKIVEHHGGTIGVESMGEGQGCVFRFELPLRRNRSAPYN